MAESVEVEPGQGKNTKKHFVYHEWYHILVYWDAIYVDRFVLGTLIFCVIYELFCCVSRCNEFDHLCFLEIR